MVDVPVPSSPEVLTGTSVVACGCHLLLVLFSGRGDNLLETGTMERPVVDKVKHLATIRINLIVATKGGRVDLRGS